jgi:hypothetical protein
MSKHKWNYEVTDIEALEKAFPKAVVTETRKGIARQVITKLLDCGVDVPGIKVTLPATPSEEAATQSEPSKVEIPTFLKGQKHA